MYYSVYQHAYASGRKVWRVQVTLDSGKQITRKVADVGIITKAEAEKIGKSFFKKIQRRKLAEKFPSAFSDSGVDIGVTIGMLREKHLRDLESRDSSRNTIEAYTATYKHLLRIFGDKAVAELSVDDFRNWRTEMLAEYKNSTVNIYHKRVKRILNFAIEEGYIGKNLWAEKPLLSEEPRDKKVIPHGHVQRLFEQITEDSPRLFFSLMYYTGCRPSEIIAIQKHHVFLNEEIPYFKTANIKARKDELKVLPIPGELIPLFRKVMRHATGKRLFTEWHDGNQSGYYFRKIAKQADLPDKYTQTWLRHSLSTSLQRKGVPTAVVSKILDHSSQEITDKYYTHLKDLEVFQDAIAKMPPIFNN